jgi:hypothetical protein
MRTSQAESIRKPIEKAIKALNDFFEQKERSRESATAFEREYERRVAMPEGTAPATKLERSAKKKYEQDVQGGSGSMPNRPRIENYYPWWHCVEEAARHLAGCGWATEAEAIDRELHDLPKDSDHIDWSQPKEREEIRTEVFKAANRIRDILTVCLRELAKVSGVSTDPTSKAQLSIEELYYALPEERQDELWIFVDFKKFKSEVRNKTRAFLLTRKDLSKYDEQSLKELVDRVRKLEIVQPKIDLRKLSSLRSKILKNSSADI